MKKRNLFFSLILAIMTFFAVNLGQQNFAFAAEPVTITFKDGSTVLFEKQTNESGTLDEIPTPSTDKNGYYFACWLYQSQKLTESTSFSSNASVFANYITRPYNFTITKITDSGGDTYKVTETINDTYNNLLISENNASLLDAIKSIRNEVPTSYAATINFNDITLSQDLIFSEENDINFKNLTISGTLSLEQYQIKFIAATENSTFGLSSLTVNSKANNNLIVIDGKRTTINTKNTTFNCSYSTDDKNNYSIFLNNSLATLNFDGSVNYQTKYLFNHKDNFNVEFTNAFSTDNDKIYITAPLTLDGKTIKTNGSNNSKFEFIPLNNIYQFNDCSTNGIYLIINAKFNIKFNKEVNEDFSTISTNYNINQQLNYPSTSLTKTHYTLNGFAGKITISGTPYYFNKTMLENYLNNNATISDISNYFSKTLPTATENNGFTYYKYNTTDINFKAVKFMLDNNQTPEFVALWSDTIYTLTLETNGGIYSGETTISETFGTNIGNNLLSPTKTGHEFKGWYTNPDFSEDSLIDETFAMPDTENSKLYAKWQANKYNLTLVLNNGETNISIQVDYNTPLSEISEFTSLELQKTGYTFTSWHSSETFTNDNKIDETSFVMPDDNVTLYVNWSINNYTITLYYNHKNNSEIFKTITQEFGSVLDKNDIMSGLLDFEGYEFLGWYKDQVGIEKYNQTKPYLPESMPATDVELYAKWHAIDYKITYYTNQSEPYSSQTLKFGNTISVLANPNITNYKFLGWYTDQNLTNLFNYTTMPSHDIVLYARLDEKQTININEEKQVYEISSNNGFKVDKNLSGFKIEYLVDDKWTKTTPTKKGSYDVKITRNEDDDYKAFSVTIENGLRITPNNVDIKIYILLLYSIAVIELIFALILLFVTKQRKSYLAYIVALPFGTVSNSQFINLIISIVLVVFGFVLIMLELTKLKKLNGEIAKISTEQQDYKPPDVSENKTISKNVDIILKKEGFYSSNEVDFSNEDKPDENTQDQKDNTETDNH